MTRCVGNAGRLGLTLLELLVVLVLLALVTATITVRIGGRLPQAAMGEAVTQLEFADLQLRVRARRAGRPVALHFEVGGNRLACAFDSENDDLRTVRTLARGVRITRFLSIAEDITHGPVAVRYSDRGTTDTFAIELQSGRKLRRWIFVAGLTGQMSEVANEGEAQELLELLAPPGFHAG